jgi:hypothetical protein
VEGAGSAGILPAYEINCRLEAGVPSSPSPAQKRRNLWIFRNEAKGSRDDFKVIRDETYKRRDKV